MTELIYQGADRDTQQRFLTHQENLQAAHTSFLSSAAWESIIGFVNSGDRSILGPEITRSIDYLDRGVELTRAGLRRAEAEQSLVRVSDRIRNADSLSRGGSMEFQAAMRLVQFTNSDGLPYQLVTDVDGTLTDMDAYRRGALIDPLLPGSALVDPLEHENPHLYRELTAAIRIPMIEQYEQLFRDGGSLVPLRPGMAELFQRHQARGGQTTIVSTNSQPFVEAVAERLQLNIHPHDIYTVSPDEDFGALAFEKDLVLQKTACRHADQVIVYVGDGGSDLATLKARGIVGVYFALEGSRFAKELQEAREYDPSIVYFTYANGYDIQDKLYNISVLQESIQSEFPGRRQQVTV